MMTMADTGGAQKAPDQTVTLREMKLKQCVLECKLESTQIALREAEFLLSHPKSALKVGSVNLSAASLSADANEEDMLEEEDDSYGICHICGKSEGLDFMICSNEGSPQHDRQSQNQEKRPSNVAERKRVTRSGNSSAVESEPSKKCTNVAAARAGEDVVFWDDPDQEDTLGDGNENRCGICKEYGELICCDGCPAAFHSKCIEFKENGIDEDWFCASCESIKSITADNPIWRSTPIVVSLFDGIGAAFVALRRLGVKPALYFSSEIDSSAINVLDAYAEKSGSKVVHLGDIRHISAKRDVFPLAREAAEKRDSGRKLNKNEPVVDLLVGGSPCTDLSHLGHRAGVVEGTQSSLFFEYVRVLRETKPRWFLFENVRMSKEDANRITKELGVEPVAVDSVDLSPCKRNRFFWTNIPIRKPRETYDDRPMTAQEIVLDDAIPATQLLTWATAGLMFFGILMANVVATTQLKRLMGFPDFYTEAENLGRRQRHILLGNSFSVYSVCHILGSLFRGVEPIRVDAEFVYKGSILPAEIQEYTPASKLQLALTKASPLTKDLAGPLTFLPNIIDPKSWENIYKPATYPHLTLGQRDQVRRALNKVLNVVSKLPTVGLPDSRHMPGQIPPDDNRVYVVMVEFTPPKSTCPSWEPALVVPRSQWDSTMPPSPDEEDSGKLFNSAKMNRPTKTAQQATELSKTHRNRRLSTAASSKSAPTTLVRFFSNHSYSHVPASNLRLLPLSETIEPLKTFCEVGGYAFQTRPYVKLALKCLREGKIEAGIRWRLSDGIVSSAFSKGLDVVGNEKKRKGKAAQKVTQQPTESINTLLQQISTRLDLATPTLYPPPADLPPSSLVSWVGSRIPKGGYADMSEAVADLERVVDLLPTPDSQKQAREGLAVIFGDGLGWVDEGMVLFVDPNVLAKEKPKKSQLPKMPWACMLIPKSETTPSLLLQPPLLPNVLVRYFADNSFSNTVPFKSLLPFNSETIEKLTKVYGHELLKEDVGIKKAWRAVNKGRGERGFEWVGFGVSGLMRFGGSIVVEEDKSSAAGGGSGEGRSGKATTGKRLREDMDEEADEIPEGHLVKLSRTTFVESTSTTASTATPGAPSPEIETATHCVSCQMPLSPISLATTPSVSRLLPIRTSSPGVKSTCNSCALRTYMATVPRIPMTPLGEIRAPRIEEEKTRRDK
ncbi:hypothetical protein HDV05_003206 [Chytridiales sp. JEL 0842]|nr:hypothetical protein HDV05_003206 [Chytridiales sp. JEL 0842]